MRFLQPRIISEQRSVGKARRLELEIRITGADVIPSVLLLPDSAAGPSPAALLIHGYSSRKEHMSENVGRALLRHGIGSLSIDLPLHGTRSDSVNAQASWNPLRIAQQWRLAASEARGAIEFLRKRPEIDAERLAVIGYSLGSFLAVSLAADDPEIRAAVIAAGGDLPVDSPFTRLARVLTDPIQSVRKLAGRPLLVVHGRQDRSVLPEQAQRLFDAAREPKEIRWWEAGHRLPQEAIDDAAQWLERTLTGGRQAT